MAIDRIGTIARSPGAMLVAGEFWNGAAARGLASAFRAHGYDVAEVDIARGLIRSTEVEFKLFNRVFNIRVGPQFNAHIREMAAQTGAKRFVTVKGSYISRATIERLRSDGIQTINYFPDVEFTHPALRMDAILAYDLIATTKPFHLPYLTAMGARNVIHVPHGFAPLTHRARRDPSTPASAADFDWDISYVGNASHHKGEWLHFIAEHFGHLRFAVFGNGWAEITRGTPLEKFVAGYPVVGDGFSRTVERSRINLGVHFGPVGEFKWQDCVSSRSFHIPAAGGFMLHIDNREIRSLYEVPEEIDVFSTRDEMIEKIRFYLGNEELRQGVATAGWQRCVRDHSIETRAAAILAAADGLDR
jgi:spore maturation protein CgeB